MMPTDHRFVVLCSKAQTRMEGKGKCLGWSGDHPWPSKSTWHTIFGSLYSLTLYYIFSKPPCNTYDGKFQSCLLSKGNGKGILFLWPGVLFRSIPVSKSLGHQIGQCDLFLIFTWQSLDRYRSLCLILR